MNMEEKVKILICEDDPDHRMLILDTLEDNLPDAEYLEAESGAECIAMLNDSLPHVLILDYRLGDMDGIEVLDVIGDRIADMAVLLVTSQGDEKIAVQAMKRGVRDYMVKDTRLTFIDHIPISVDHALQYIRTQKEKARTQEKLKASERLNRTILDKMMEAVLFVNRDDRIVHLNGLACDILNTTVEKARNTNLSDHQSKEIFPDMYGMLQELKQDEEKLFIEQERAVSDRVLLLRLSPVRDARNKYQGAVINLVDITELRKEEIKRMAAIENTVSALAKAVELRDPYTSGHAANVAFIAVEIADYLGWDARRKTGLRLAGELHDIGKIAIPAEILTRPTQLSSLERAMLREHPGNGYEILKDIKFPFPIAEAVYQHHEVLDGSGYPRGLTGDRIIPEARILTVADVVEAITAHRPYRAGLGIDKAVAYLKSGRGKLFDAVFVDAVIQLIEENGNKPFWGMKKTRSKTDVGDLRNNHREN